MPGGKGGREQRWGSGFTSGNSCAPAGGACCNDLQHRDNSQTKGLRKGGYLNSPITVASACRLGQLCQYLVEAMAGQFGLSESGHVSGI